MKDFQITTVQDLNYLAKQIFEMLPKALKGLTVSVKVNRKLKSKEQRGYYRGVLVRTLAEGLGYPKYEDDLVHQGLKELFCPAKKNKAGFMVKSTELLDSKETEIYYTECRTFASMERGIFIPLPNGEEYV